MWFLMYGLCFSAAALAGMASYPPLAQRFATSIRRRAEEATAQLADLFIDLPHRRVWLVHAASPAVVGGLAWLVTGNWIIGSLGTIVGIVVPRLVVAQIRRLHRKRFHDQLVDGLLLLSSSLKAGLSMSQALTVVVEEMPSPIAQELGLVLKETRMGVTLDEAMWHLKERVPGDDVSLFVTAMLVARETGGDITLVFARLVETIRDRKKLKEKIKTLTFMARMQGCIMALLPVVFGYLVYSMNHRYFDFFVTDPIGRMLLVGIVLLQCVGGLLFLRFSRSPL